MMAHRSTKRRPRGCRRDRVARRSGARPEDAQAAGFIRTALGSSRGMANQLENVLPKLHTPLIITARHPSEGEPGIAARARGSAR